MGWNESFKEYAVKIARIYKAAPDDTVKCLGLGSVAGCLNESYLSLVREKEIVPLEDLAQEKKMELWNKAKKVSSDKTRCIEISRSIYLLEILT